MKKGRLVRIIIVVIMSVILSVIDNRKLSWEDRVLIANSEPADARRKTACNLSHERLSGGKTWGSKPISDLMDVKIFTGHVDVDIDA